MTRKDYIALARVLKRRKAAMGEEAHLLVAQDIADVCASENRNFDRGIFMRACGVGS